MSTIDNQIKNNLREIEELICSMEREHHYPRNDFKIRIARIHMCETIKMVKNHQDKLGENTMQKFIDKMNEFEQSISFYQRLRVGIGRRL